MNDPFYITLLILIVVTLISAITRQLNIDKCLKDFEGDKIIIETTSGKILNEGRLRIESTGLELVHEHSHAAVQIMEQHSSLFYKYEYKNVQAIIKAHDRMSPEDKNKRELEKNKIYKPGFVPRIKRKIDNMLNTLKDALNEISNLFFAHFQAKNPYLKNTNKFVTKMNADIIDSVGIAHDPLLERYIGRKVVFEIQHGDEIEEYIGVLKDYTSQFIELWDVKYLLRDKFILADLIVNQNRTVIRHLAEPHSESILKAFYSKVGRMLPHQLQDESKQ